MQTGRRGGGASGRGRQASWEGGGHVHLHGGGRSRWVERGMRTDWTLEEVGRCGRVKDQGGPWGNKGKEDQASQARGEAPQTHECSETNQYERTTDLRLRGQRARWTTCVGRRECRGKEEEGGFRVGCRRWGKPTGAVSSLGLRAPSEPTARDDPRACVPAK